MPVDLSVQGADDLKLVADRLKQVGDKELRRELFRGMQRAAKPLRAAASRSARQNLPSRGGLNDWVAASKFGVSTKTGRDPSVSVTGRKAGHDLRALDRGRLRHPLFGNRRHWYVQQIRPGWFSEAMRAEAPGVRREVVNVLEDVARKLAYGR